VSPKSWRTFLVFSFKRGEEEERVEGEGVAEDADEAGVAVVVIYNTTSCYRFIFRIFECALPAPLPNPKEKVYSHTRMVLRFPVLKGGLI
jgi:hypothetical protein